MHHRIADLLLMLYNLYGCIAQKANIMSDQPKPEDTHKPAAPATPHAQAPTPATPPVKTPDVKK